MKLPDSTELCQTRIVRHEFLWPFYAGDFCCDFSGDFQSDFTVNHWRFRGDSLDEIALEIAAEIASVNGSQEGSNDVH